MPDEAILRWTSQGIFARHRPSPFETAIDRIDPATGHRTRVYSFNLPEGSANFNEPTVLSPSGKVYAFTYQRDIASLYLAGGLS